MSGSVNTGKGEKMSRYIDAEYVKAVMINDRLLQGNAELNLYVQQVEIQVKAIPGINIVRCKECKWRMTCLNPYSKNDDDFCSYGEREGE